LNNAAFAIAFLGLTSRVHLASFIMLVLAKLISF